MADIIQIRRDTAALWTTHNPILAAGEFGYENDTAKIKIGDGTTTWTSLGYYVIEGVTSTAEELNILDGVTSTTAELNKLDGVTVTTAELNSVTAKSPIASPTFTGAVNASGTLQLAGTTITSTAAELNILDGVTATSTELNKLDALSRGSILYGNASGATTVLTKGTAGQLLKSDGTDISWGSAEASDLTFVGRTSNTQLGASNKGNFINVTANSFTQTFDTAANLGAGWWCTLKNSGSGVVTVQPGTLGSELFTEGNLSTLATGGELCVNGTFASDSNWTKAGNWSISGGKANSNGGSGNLTQSGSTVIQAGRMYLCTYDVIRNSGNIQIALGQETTAGYDGNTTHKRILISENTETIKFEATNFNGSIDNVSVKLITNWRAGRADGQRDQWRWNDTTNESDSGLFWYTDSLPVYNSSSGQPDGNWLGQPISLTSGNAYRLSIDIKSTGGYATTSRWVPILTGGATLQLSGQYGDGTLTTKTWDFTATGNHTMLQMCCMDNAQQGVLDNWSLKGVNGAIDGAITLPLLPEREARISTDGTNFYAGPRAIPNFEAKLVLNCDKNGNIEYQKNVSSITDTATGQLTVTIDNDFGRADYVVNATAQQGTGFGHLCTIKDNKTGGTFMVLSHSGDYQDTASDPDRYNIVAFGE